MSLPPLALFIFLWDRLNNKSFPRFVYSPRRSVWVFCHASNHQNKDHGAEPSPHVRPVRGIFHRRDHHHRMPAFM